MINLDCLSTVFLRYDWNTRRGTSIKWTTWWALGLSQCESIITVKIVNNSPVPRMPLCLQYGLSIPHSQTPTNVLPVTMGLISFSRTLHESNPIIMLFGGRGMWEPCLWPTHRADFLWDSPTLLPGSLIQVFWLVRRFIYTFLFVAREFPVWELSQMKPRWMIMHRLYCEWFDLSW